MAVAEKAKSDGHDVVIGLINGDESARECAPDFPMHLLKKSENAIGVASSLKMVNDMRKLVKDEDPDIMHVVTLKYSFMASMATAANNDMRKIYTIAGLGYLFRSDDPKSALLRNAVRPFMTFGMRRPNTSLIFQNADDLNLLVEQGYAKPENCKLIKGSGVYLDRFTPRAQDEHKENPVVLMPTRLVHEKGVSVFVDAARILKQKGVQAQFQIAGGETKHNPKAISRAEMENMVSDGSAEWLGRVENMPELLADAQLVVYPSYYGEGIPRVLLESCAAGKAIVTTDHPGCREAVDNGINGKLVPVKDAFETANAIESILQDHAARQGMERASRAKAEAEFDIHKIVEQTVALYQ